ncbi:MAG: protein kinase [Verrucomicrobiales bacterium]|nr:protein kinase [Verrucomicrobiales bacterium]
MRTCDTCGCPLDDADLFVVCPRCLFASALGSGVALDPSGTEAAIGGKLDTAEACGFLAHLSVESDFTHRYELQERKWQGGQGEILKAWDLRLRRPLAMKRVGSSGSFGPAGIARFLAEAQIAGQLQHPGILPVHDVGLDLDGRPFYTTDLLPGATLGDIFLEVRRSPTPERAVAQALEQLARVCEIVGHAHSRGVIHRDLKPENVLVGEFGDVRVIDWGSAHVTTEAPRGLDLHPATGGVFKDGESRDGTREEPEAGPLPPVLTRRSAGASSGDPGSGPVRTDRSDSLQRKPDSTLATSHSGQPITVLFTPPECLDGTWRMPTPSIDVYAIGVMLYELCAGRKPYADVEGHLPISEELRRRILAGAPTPVRQVRRGIPRDLSAICQKAMARNPACRYADMLALAGDIRAFLQVRPVKARPSGLIGTLRKWARRHSLAVAAGSMAITLLGLTTSVAFRINAERRRVDAERRQALGDELAARQLKVMRESDLAARDGKWKDVLGHLQTAEGIGFADAFELALRRLEAWIVLWEPERARGELKKLTAMDGLDPDRQALLALRLGEFDLFDPATAEQGIAQVRAALRLGLADRAETNFAQGLIAPTTTEALEFFRAALAQNPNHHGAHRCSLGLEMLTGQHEALAAHIKVFGALFPDDPTPALAQAISLAFRGDLNGAKALLEEKRAALGDSPTELVAAVLELFAHTLPEFDVEYVVGDRQAPPLDLEPIMKRFGGLLLIGSLDLGQFLQSFAGRFVTEPFLQDASTDPHLRRLPQLPCIKAGALDGSRELLSVAFPFQVQPAEALKRIKPHWEVHREALLPYGVAYIMEHRVSPDRGREPEFVAGQAELYDLAAESFSVFPSLPRLARYRAALAHFQLAKQGHNSHATSCLAQVRRAIPAPNLSGAELREYFSMAYELGDQALAAELLPRWGRTRPDDPLLGLGRIKFQLATGALGPALEALDKMLQEDPNNEWALKQREKALDQLRKLTEKTPTADLK